MIIDFDKSNGIVPAIVQDANTCKVLMLGYMNEAALNKTKEFGKVTFFSRSKQRLWTKGETSGNELLTKEILTDCDNDTILIKAVPTGPVCHTGSDTCFEERNTNSLMFLNQLENIIEKRKINPSEKSYTSTLFKEGTSKIAQKVGEEATEVVIEAMQNDIPAFKEECADLLFHLMVLINSMDLSLEDVINTLSKRHIKK